MKLSFLTIVLTTAVLSAQAQDLKTVLSDMHQRLKQATKMHIVMDVSVFAKGERVTPVYHDKTDIAKNGNGYLYHFGNSIFFMGPRFIIMVDQDEKEITCGVRDASSESDFAKSVAINIDSIFQLYRNPQHVATENGIDHFLLFQDNSPISQVDFFVDLSSGKIKQLRYLYRNGQLVSIDFDVFDLEPVFAEGLFNEANYVVVKQNKLYTADRFRNFRINSVHRTNQ